MGLNITKSLVVYDRNVLLSSNGTQHRSLTNSARTCDVDYGNQTQGTMQASKAEAITTSENKTRKEYSLSIDGASKRHSISISGQYRQMCCTCFDWHVIPWTTIVTGSVCFVIRDEVSKFICKFSTHHFLDGLEARFKNNSQGQTLS